MLTSLATKNNRRFEDCAKSRPPSTTSQERQPGELWRQDWLLALLLAIMTMVAYLPAWNGSPIWDDDAHLTKPELRSLDGLARIWTQPGATQQYYPLVHTVFWLEHQLWGDWPANEKTGRANPTILRILAAAFAQAGHFSEAVETAEQGLQIATAQNNAALVEALRGEIGLYQNGISYRAR
jgi:hypothetical protein